MVDPVVVVAERDRWRSFPSSRGRRGGSGGASRRPRASPDRIGTWEREVVVILGVCAPTPLPFFIARATGAHQPYGLDTPDQGVFKGSARSTKFIPYSILVYMEKWLHTTCMQAFSQFFYINDERIKYITYKLM